MIVPGTVVRWRIEPGLVGVVLSMSRWRRLAEVEVYTVPPKSTVQPGLVCLVYTEDLVERATQSIE